MPEGAPRVTAYLLLTNGVIQDNDDIRRLLKLALAEAATDDELRAPVLADLAENQAVIEVADVAQAEQWATEALSSSKAHRPDHQRLALYALSWTRALSGHPITDLSERHTLVSEDRFFLAQSPDRVAGQRHVWRGEVKQARDLLNTLQVLAEERAEPSAYALQRLHLCELMLRTGDWATLNGCSTNGHPPLTASCCTGRCTSVAARFSQRDAETPTTRDAGARRP